ncbi:GNAT family N-acetyltransferase [Methylocystis sp. SC2]|uniref:GNAT family N-acetyltransferase n=1 Tax=Methylocystis sp. (strain SC2) TaxID=187303 RepID=UPI00027AF424|nr:GNAT family N-acetyltransferase [Methylocystis sp. SC2]CCJ09018.1 GCN5-related N-acetyltransferase [Methylocystis sp. SC2]
MNAPPAHASLSLRARVDADWPFILDVWVASWRVTYPEIDFEGRRDWLLRRIRELEEAGAVTLCLFDAQSALAGFVVINPADGWLDQICVAPDRFGAGFGALLLSAARNVSPRLIRLDVNADNARAIRFYERDGFSRVGRGANTLSGRETVMMEWRPQGD